MHYSENMFEFLAERLFSNLAFQKKQGDMTQKW